MLTAAVMLTSCGNWRGIANVPLPGGPGSGPGSYKIYVQMPNTMALNGNSRVLVADVFVGTVRSIDLKNWVATLTVDLDKSVKLPKNATAKIGQTSLLGSQHIELAVPPDPSPQCVEGRRHHRVEQFLGVSLHRTDAGQLGDGVARGRHPEPRSHPE